ncbi:MAG: wax ester/triacylglycerol synthase domain-containing protein [Betaproteobacteria bacterium]
MSGNQRERMSSVDTAWLRMDRPSNLMMICGVLIFRDRVAFAGLKKTLADRFLRFARFRQRPLQTPTGSYWQTDDQFDFANHLERVALPGRAGKAELEAFVSTLAGMQLDPGRPLWQFHLIERFDGGSALVVRIHHCYADGIALIQVMLSLTDADRAGAAAGPHGKPARR